MTPYEIPDEPRFSRRSVISSALAAAGGAAAFGAEATAAKTELKPDTANARSQKRFDMKKSINLWAFPYPDRMSLEQCLRLAKDAGFDGIELNYDLDNDLSPKSGTREYHETPKAGRQDRHRDQRTLLVPVLAVSADQQRSGQARQALELAGKMTQAAHDLGTENLLVVPGAVHIPWRTDYEPVPNDVCDRRAREAIGKLVPLAEKLNVNLNIENIFFNGYLMTPGEMIAFVDSFHSPRVHVHFDTGNIMLFQFPEHWISILGKRIQNVHLKEFTKKGTDHSLESFRPLLDGTTNWPAVLDAFDATGYRGYLTFEYFHPYQHYPEALIYQTSDSLDRMLGRK